MITKNEKIYSKTDGKPYIIETITYIEEAFILLYTSVFECEGGKNGVSALMKGDGSFQKRKMPRETD